jgi:hypothetical protein
MKAMNPANRMDATAAIISQRRRARRIDQPAKAALIAGVTRSTV